MNGIVHHPHCTVTVHMFWNMHTDLGYGKHKEMLYMCYHFKRTQRN